MLSQYDKYGSCRLAKRAFGTARMSGMSLCLMAGSLR